MKLEEIIELWRVDSKIDDLNIDIEGANIPKLHAKYAEILTKERSINRMLLLEKKQLTRNLREYYLGTATQDLLDKLKRSPNPTRILKNEVYQYIDTDEEILALETKIQVQEEKVALLLEIMKSLSQRTYTIKTITDWKKMMLGA